MVRGGRIIYLLDGVLVAWGFGFAYLSIVSWVEFCGEFFVELFRWVVE